MAGMFGKIIYLYFLIRGTLGATVETTSCFEENGDETNMFPCQVYNQSVCNKFDPDLWPKGNITDPDKNSMEYILLTEINLIALPASVTNLTAQNTSTTNSTDSSDAFSLTFSWLLKQDQEKFINGYIVRMTGKGLSGNCALYNFSGWVFTLNSSQKFTYTCVQKLMVNHAYLIHIASLPVQPKTAEYYLHLPNRITQVWDPGKASDWVTPIAVMAFSGHKIHAVFHLAPDFFNFTYRIRLDDQKSHGANYTLDQNVNQHLFTDIAPGTYIIVIQPESPLCQGPCSESISNPVELTDPFAHTKSPWTKQQSTTAAVPFPDDLSTPKNETTDTTDSSVIVKPSDNGDYKKKVVIVLATVFGFCGGVVAVIGIVWCYRHRVLRSAGRSGLQRFGQEEEGGGVAISLDHGVLPRKPVVLLLYSYDCPSHEKVVSIFAIYLRQVFGCDVIFDIWQQAEIQERGAFDWLEEKLVTAQFILFVCSTGARYKCGKQKKFHLKNDRSVADIFAYAVSSVAEMMRVTGYRGETMNKFIVVYFQYATENDIPHKLDRASKYSLLTDLFSLYHHLHGVKLEVSACRSSAPNRGKMLETFTRSPEGVDLKNTVEEATRYFQQNPDWLGERLEPVNHPSPAKSSNSTDPEQNGEQGENVLDGEDNSSVHEGSVSSLENGSIHSTNEKQFLLKSHDRKKREFHKKWRDNDRTRSWNDSHTPQLSPATQHYSPVMDPLKSGSEQEELRNQTQSKTNGNSTYVYSNESLGLLEGEEEEDDLQLQKDIEFIQNFDNLQNHSIPHSSHLQSHSSFPSTLGLPADNQNVFALKKLNADRTVSCNGSVQTELSVNPSLGAFKHSSNHGNKTQCGTTSATSAFDPNGTASPQRSFDQNSSTSQNIELLLKPLGDAMSQRSSKQGNNVIKI